MMFCLRFFVAFTPAMPLRSNRLPWSELLRAEAHLRLVGFITGIPAKIRALTPVDQWL